MNYKLPQQMAKLAKTIPAGALSLKTFISRSDVRATMWLPAAHSVAIAALMASMASAGVSVRDADTVVVSGTPVRLQGVDAPELSTRAGQDARRWMVRFLSGKEVSCDLTGERTYDRYVGTCFANGTDIGAAVIAAGHALDCRRYSGGRYAHLETPAAKSRLNRARYC